ncbi:hypothetical protein GN156_11560 [bacterium LRH843]|nr:hypothetical protein [bacterium LRH843]
MMQGKNLKFEWISTTRGYLLFVLSFLFVLFNLIGVSAQSLLVTLTVISVIYSFPFMAIFPKIMALLMLGLGHYLYFTTPADFGYWQQAMLKNLPMVAMFISVPLFAYPLRNGGYVHYITELSKRLIKSPFKLFMNMSLGAMALTSFINLGSARIIFELFEGYIRGNNKFYTKALSQGFSLAMCWSPYIAGVAIVISMLDLPIFPFLFWGFLLVVTGSLVSMLLIYKEAKRLSLFSIESDAAKEMAGSKEIDASCRSVNKGREMIIVFAGMFISLFVLDYFLETNIVVLISVVAFVYPVIWSICIKKTKAFFGSLTDYKVNVLSRMHNEAILFIAAAFFAEMIKLTSVSQKLMALFVFVSELTPLLVIFITIFLVVLPTVVGIHQILPVSILGTSIAVSSLSVSPEAFGLCLMAGWSLSTVISPVTGLNLTLSSLLNKNPYVVGFWNLPYVLTALVAFSFVIYLVNIFTV